MSTATYCQCGKMLHTKHCLAELFNCKPRAVVRMAAKGLWPSTRALREYRFTDEMIAAIIALPARWPKDTPSTPNQASPQRAKAVKPPQSTPRRTRQPQPAPISGSNVRPLVAKGPRIGRAS